MTFSDALAMALKYAPLAGWVAGAGALASAAAVATISHYGGPDMPYAGNKKFQELAQNVQQMQRTNDAQINAFRGMSQANSLELLPLWQGQRTTACAALRRNPSDEIAMQHYEAADGHVKALEKQLGMIPSDGCPR